LQSFSANQAYKPSLGHNKQVKLADIFADNAVRNILTPADHDSATQSPFQPHYKFNLIKTRCDYLGGLAPLPFSAEIHLC